MKIIIICIMLMLFGCNAQPNTSNQPNTQNNSTTETINETVNQTIEEDEEKVFLLIEEQYYVNGILNDNLYFHYDDLGRLIAEDSYAGNLEYTYIGDTDKVRLMMSDWIIYSYEYDNLGRLKSMIGTYEEGEVYSETKYKYHGDLIIEEYSYYPFSNSTEIVSYKYEDGLLISKNYESIMNDTYDVYSSLEVYSYGGEIEKPATIEVYYFGYLLSNIYRHHYKNGLLIKKEIIDFDYDTGNLSYYSYLEYEYDECGNLISEKYCYEGECFSEIKYIYEEFKK